MSESLAEKPVESPPKFQVKNLKAGFGDNEVLHGIDMLVPDRGVTAIIGPSGCGKSTLIRCLNRMHELVPSAFVSGGVLLRGGCAAEGAASGAGVGSEGPPGTNALAAADGTKAGAAADIDPSLSAIVLLP